MITASLSAVLFDLDGTLYDRAACLRDFLFAQYDRRRDILGAISREAFVDRFVAYDANGSVRRDIVYPRILNEIGGDPQATPLLVADYVEGFRNFCRPPDDLFPTLGGCAAMACVSAWSPTGRCASSATRSPDWD